MQTGRTTAMLENALDLIPVTGSIPIIIICKNYSEVDRIMREFDKLAWDLGYHVCTKRKYSFLVDHEAIVHFMPHEGMDRRLSGIGFIELFIDHIAEDHLPQADKVEFVQLLDSATPSFYSQIAPGSSSE